ncbi:glycosyltransferase family 4 protein [soil metagenome]
MSTTPTMPPSPIEKLSVLEIGMGWFPEQAGGLNRVYHDLVNSLPGVGVRCAGVITGSDRAARESNGAIRAVVPTDAPLLQRWKAIRAAVTDAISRERIDLVAAHFAVYAWPMLGKLGRTPFVYHFHGPWAAESASQGAGKLSTTAKALLEKRVYRRADRVIVLSSAFRELICESYGVERERVHVVPGAVDCDRYDIPLSRAEARQCLGWPADRPTLLAVRRLVPRMGLEDLITAAKELSQKFPGLRVHIAGKGPLGDTLQRQIDTAGLQGTVKLLGFVSDEDLPVAYRAADLSVVPTVALEGFGLIAIESLAAGTPVIVTPVGGLPEAVRGLSPQLICSAPGAEALTETLSAALSNPTALPSADTCQVYARANHDLAVIAAMTKAVYQGAVRD